MSKDANSMIALARDTAGLNKAVSSFGTRYKSINEEAHYLAVTTLVHAALHGGECRPLNRFFEMLNPNDKQAFRGSFVPRVFAALGGIDFAKYVVKGDNGEPKNLDIDADLVQAARDAGAWMGYQSTGNANHDKGFFVISKDDKPEAPKLREAFIKLAESHLVEPDVWKGWKRFNERNNFAEARVFGNDNLVEGLKRLKQSANREDAAVDAMLKKVIDTAVDNAEREFAKLKAKAEDAAKDKAARSKRNVRTKAKGQPAPKRTKEHTAEANASTATH